MNLQSLEFQGNTILYFGLLCSKRGEHSVGTLRFTRPAPALRP